MWSSKQAAPLLSEEQVAESQLPPPTPDDGDANEPLVEPIRATIGNRLAALFSSAPDPRSERSERSERGERLSQLFSSAPEEHAEPSPPPPPPPPEPPSAADESEERSLSPLQALRAGALPINAPRRVNPEGEEEQALVHSPGTDRWRARASSTTLGPVEREKGGLVGLFRLYLQVGRLVSTYVLTCCLLLFCSQWLSLIVNMTPLGSYSAQHEVVLGPAGLSLVLPVLWLVGGLFVSMYYHLIVDAARAQTFGYVRTVVLPDMLLLPLACVANALGRCADRCRSRGPAWWPVHVEHGLFTLSSKPWRATMAVGPRAQLALDVLLVVALHLCPLVVAAFVTAGGFVELEAADLAQAPDTMYFGNLFMWLVGAHKGLVLAVALHELVLLLIDFGCEAQLHRRAWRSWYYGDDGGGGGGTPGGRRSRGGLGGGEFEARMAANERAAADANNSSSNSVALAKQRRRHARAASCCFCACPICSCLCFTRRVERVLFEEPLVFLPGQLGYEPCSRLPTLGARCAAVSSAFRRCSKAGWKRCRPLTALVGFVFLLGLSLAVSGFLAHLPSADTVHTPLDELVRGAGAWVWPWLGLTAGVSISGLALRYLVWFRCLHAPRVATFAYCLFALPSLVAMLFTQMSVSEAPPPPVTTPCFSPKLYLQPTEHVAHPSARYAICDSKWRGLDIVDLAVMSSIMAYYPPSDFLISVTNAYLPAGWQYVGGSRAGSQPMWQEYYRAETNTSVINIMGTSTWGDFFYDMQLWMSTFWIEFVLLPLLPFNSWVQRAATTSIYQEATSGTPIPGYSLDVSQGVGEYLRPVIEYAKHTARGADVLMTGHSLGGGLAKAVSAVLNVEAVSFEGPGVVNPFVGLFYRQPWGRRSQFNSIVNVRGKSDLVAWMGTDIGYTQDVECNGFPRLPVVSCHLTIASVLLHNCKPANTTFVNRTGNSQTLQYCPGLNDTLPDPPPPGIRLVDTPRNLYRSG